MEQPQRRKCAFKNSRGKVCGTDLPHHLKFCLNCGGHVGSEQCKGCQAWLHPRGKYCGNCGLITVVLDLARARVAQKPADDSMGAAMTGAPQKATTTAGEQKVKEPDEKCDVTSGGWVVPPGVREANKELALKAAKKAQEMVRVGLAESSMGGENESVGGETESVGVQTSQLEGEDRQGVPLSHRHAIRRPSAPSGSQESSQVDKPEVASPIAKNPKFF